LAQIVARHGKNRGVEIDSSQKMLSAQFALAEHAYAGTGVRRAKRDGHPCL
jgi:hypothetical protein